MRQYPAVVRWLIAVALLVTLAGMQAFPSTARTLPLLPTVTPPVDLPDVDLPIPTVAVPTVAVPTIEVPDVDVPDVDVPDVDVPVDVPDVDVPIDPTAVVPIDIQDPAGQSTDEIGAEAVDGEVALTVTVINCGADIALDADAVVLGSLDAAALVGLGCVPADGVTISVTGEGDTDLGGGSTVAGNLIVPGLTAGATVTVSEDAPAGFLALTETQSVVVAADLGLLFVNVDADADVTADLAITKISCGAEVELDADLVVLDTLDADALLELGCVLADDVAFTLTGSGGVDLGDGATVDGLLTVQDLEVGARVRVEEAVPDGFIALTRAQTVVLVPGLELQFVNVAADADVTADLTIRAVNCGADVQIDADAVVLDGLSVEALLDLGCELADGVEFDVVGDGDVALGDGATVDGVLTIEDLDVGQTVTVTGSTPEGFVALTETQVSVILPGRELIFVNVDAEADVTADLTINKLNCAIDVDLDAEAVVLGQVDVAALLELGCELADDVAFTVTADAGAELGDGVTVDGVATVEDLAVGTAITVRETVPDGFVALTEVQAAVVVPGLELLFVNVDADADVDVDLTITKVSCEADAVVDVDATLLASLDADALLELGCTLTDDVAFTVTGDAGAALGDGLTVDGLVTIEDLELGAAVTVSETVPDGFVALNGVQTVVLTPGLGLLFVNVAADADLDVDLGITKVNCDVEAVADVDATVLASLDLSALLELGCVPADDVAFTVTGGTGVALGDGVTVDGVATIEGLALGATVTVTETVPSGFVALTPSQVAILTPGLNLLFVNVAADADLDVGLTITKVSCGVDALVDVDAAILATLDADALLELGCTLTDDVAFTVTGDAGAELGGGLTVDGLVTIDDLALGATVTVRETVPDGFVALTEVQTVVLVPGLNLLFVNVDADADVEVDLDITKITCAADAVVDVDATLLASLDADALLELGCTLADDVAFTVTGEGGVVLGNGLTVDGLLTVENLALGATVTVTETVPAGSIALTPSQVTVVVPGLDLLFVNVDVDADIDVDLDITKINCGLDVELDVEAILLSQVDAAALLELGCELADDVAFTVTADGGATLGNGVTVDGLVTVEDIALGTTVTVRETVPSGYTALTEVQVVVTLPGLDLLFVNVEGGGSATATATPNAATRTAIAMTPTATSITVPPGGSTVTPTPDPDGADPTVMPPGPGGGGEDATATPTGTPDGGGNDPTSTPDGDGDDSTATPGPDGSNPSTTPTGDDDDDLVVTALPNTGAGGGLDGGLGALLAALLLTGVAALGFLATVRRRRGARIG